MIGPTMRQWAQALAVGALLGAGAAFGQTGFEAAARGALQVPFGDRAGVPLSDSFDMRPGFQLEAGARFQRGRFSLLALVAFGPGVARPPPGTPPDAAPRTPAHLWRFGAQLLWRPMMFDYVEPWGGFAVGVESFLGDAGLFFTPQVGFDFRIFRFRFGPYLEAPLGVFLRSVPAGSEFHGWINVGLKLALVLG